MKCYYDVKAKSNTQMITTNLRVKMQFKEELKQFA